MSSSIFVGPTLTHDAHWQSIIQSYTVNLFNACRVLRAWPAFLRPIAVWFIKECKECRAQITEAREILASLDLDDEKSKTAFAWMDPRADPVIIQLALAAGALHTTSQLLNQTLLDLAYAGNTNHSIVEQVREEYRDSTGLTEGRIVPPTLPKMRILESCIKETQRLKPQTMTNLDRLAMKPVVLPDGLPLPRGTMISVNQSTMWSTQTWGHDAATWKPTRWLETGGGGEVLNLSHSKLMNSSERHFAFGKGRFICPGRFLVNGELKIAIALILDGWDVRLSEQDYERARKTELRRVPWVPYGFEMIANDAVVIEVRKRAQ